MQAATSHTREVEPLQKVPSCTACLAWEFLAGVFTPAVTLKASTHGDSNPLHSQCATATKGSGDIWLHGTKMLGQYNPEAALQHQTPAGLCQKTGQFNSGAASTPQLALQHPSLVTGSLMFWATEKKKISLSPSRPVVLRI